MRLKDYDGPVKFGDEKLIAMINNSRKKDIEKRKISVDVRTLVQVGLEKAQAVNLLERLIRLKENK